MGSALEVKPLQYGVAAENIGEARVFREAVEIVAARKHPRAMRQQFAGTLRRQVQGLIQLASTHGDALDVYAERFARITRAGRRPGRNILGDGLRWLTGAATLEDVQAVRDSVEGMADQLQAQGAILKGTVACVQADREEMAALAEKTQELINVINRQAQELRNTSLVLNDLYSMTFELQLKITIENALSYLEVFESEMQRYESIFKYHRDLSEIGHLTESLLPRNNLSAVLNLIHVDLPIDYLYVNLNVRVLVLAGDRLGFWVTIVTKVLPPGTYLINVATHCIIDSDKGWRYQAIHVARKVLNVMDVFVLAKVNVSFTNLESVLPRMDNFVDVHQVKDLIVNHQPELPDVKALRPVQVYNLAGSSIGLGGAVIVLIVLVVLIRLWCLRHWLRPKAKRPVVVPMTEMEPTAPLPDKDVETPQVTQAIAPMSSVPPANQSVPKLYLPVPMPEGAIPQIKTCLVDSFYLRKRREGV